MWFTESGSCVSLAVTPRVCLCPQSAMDTAAWLLASLCYLLVSRAGSWQVERRPLWDKTIREPGEGLVSMSQPRQEMRVVVGSSVLTRL